MADNSRNQRPLDEAFINAVVNLIYAPSSPGGTAAAAVNPETRRFWEAVFERAADVEPAEIAEELNRRVETGTLSVQAFANDPRIRGILEQGGYNVASQASGSTPAVPSRGSITPAETLRSAVGGLPTPSGDGSPSLARTVRRGIPVCDKTISSSHLTSDPDQRINIRFFFNQRALLLERPSRP